MKRTTRFVVSVAAIGMTVGALSAVPPAAAAQIAAPTPAPAVVRDRVIALPQPQARAVTATVAAAVASGPSRWRGAPLRHPRGVAFYPAVLRWANLVRVVMGELKIPQGYLAGILSQIQQESAGQPNAINLWDSNAKAGIPSMGLLQIVAPTYRTYAKPGFKSLKYQAVPYTNLWAALKYAKSKYGMTKFIAWSAGNNVNY
ncbi:MAG: transglycosylase SLT domain-containing protein [Actinomycetes bacterium]